MRYFALKRHLPDLICIFIISALFIGCAAKVKTVPDSVDVISPKYYIMKKSTQADYDKLETLTKSPNKYAAASAGLILGYYYLVYDKDYAKAEKQINAYYNNPDLDDYMKRMGELWQMDLSLVKDNKTDALIWAERVKSTRNQSATEEALKTYCITNNLLAKGSEGPYNCVEQKLAGKDNATVSEQQRERELLSGTLNILVTSQADPQDASGGVYFYMKAHNIHHKVSMSRSFREGDWDYIIDVDNGYLAGRGYGIFFAPDLRNILSGFESYISLKGCEKVIIGAGKGLSESAKILKKILTDEAVPVVDIVDITDSGVARHIRTYMTDWEQSNFCALGAGNEAEINNFIPNVRQFTLLPEIQKVYELISVDTGKNYTRNYLAYYKNTLLFPAIELNLSEHMKDFAMEYKDFSGRDLTYEAVIGYDMMHYINLQTEAGANLTEPYLTNIIGIAGDRVQRTVKAYYVDENGKIEAAAVSTDKVE